ncbi:hypothetical protein [Pontibacter actiniarum]|uniref:Uncharacterized protein n=1 Tax=Pontibacter actiniarum TaxID=323450 RepID=A0A1X9YP46_9BACT|nr:hypothetical protein [Pontibacter actiniarum]ARS34639.1 hypothetical protein CA264_03790 [Pontibacter actiniarum]
MKNYSLLRFVKLNLYFFGMYSLLTAVWYALSGKFTAGAAGAALQEIAQDGALFALLFSLAMLLLYRRTELRLPTQAYTLQQLQQYLAAAGYLQVQAKGKEQLLLVYKPVPPRAPALAGKVFVQQTANFFVLQGPAKLLKELQGK